MPRAPTTTDAFNAVAEPRRRLIIDALARAGGAMGVGAMVAALGLPQPTVSKHLAVLREVGLVSVERAGQHRLYRLHPEELRTMHDWLKQYDRLWTNQLDRIKQRAERAQRAAAATNPPRSA